MVTAEQIKKLREKTGAGIIDCRRALQESDGDEKKAQALLQSWGIEKAAKKEDRETKQGGIASYIHANGTVGAMIELFCETDFVARTDDFKNLAHEICMQVAAMNPTNAQELEKQPYIRDNKLTILDLIKKTIAKVGENIKIGRITRFAINDK